MIQQANSLEYINVLIRVQISSFRILVCGFLSRSIALLVLTTSSLSGNVSASSSHTEAVPLNVYSGYVAARPRVEGPIDEDQRIFYHGGTPLAPVGNVKLYTGTGNRGFTFSSNDGSYSLGFYGPPCHGSFYNFHDVISAEYYPNVSPRFPIFNLANTYIPILVSCIGLEVYALRGTSTLLSGINALALDRILNDVRVGTTTDQLNIIMDTMLVSGAVRMLNDGINIPLGSITLYDNFGLITQISQEDLDDTDIFVYNQRTGELIGDLSFSPLTSSGSGPSSTFQLPIFGPYYNLVYKSLSQAAVGWASPTVFSDFSTVIGQAATRARPGDAIRVYAINRATGYLGYADTTLESIGRGGEPDNKDIAVVIVDMEPPNIKVLAERSYEIQRGSTQGQERNYLIGFEGSAMKNDEVIKITTDWRAADNTPIPEEIPGYTARIARITDGNSGPSSLGEIATFDMNPGVTQQWIYTPLTEFLSNGDHIYMHLCAQPPGSGEPCNFDRVRTGITTPGALISRPLSSVPMKVLEYGSRSYGSSVGNIPESDWILRHEMQFSIFDLTMDSIQLTRKDAVSSVDIFSLTDAPIISWEDQQVDIVYRLDSPSYGSALNPLPRVGAPREFVFSFADQTVSADINQDSNAVFTDLSPIRDAFTQASPEEYLTFRLFQGSDAGNILWEFGFGQGLHVFYKIPDDETEIFIEPDNGTNLIRTLGGIRLKYEYYIPPGATLNRIVWNFSEHGRYCTDYGVGSGDCTMVDGGDDYEAVPATKVYWEPTNGNAAGATTRWDTDFTSNATITATYINGNNQFTDDVAFTVSSRQLEANSVAMEGSDVEMLETLLWQFGLGPNGNVRGVNSIRKIENVRDTFDIGCSVGGCSTTGGNTSMEWMVWRYKYSNEIDGTYTGVNLGIANTQVNQSTLNIISRQYSSYMLAYEYESAAIVNGAHQLYNNWLTTAVAHWDVNGLYTQARHSATMQVAGTAAVTRENLLDAWIAQESTRRQWGVNNTSHRIIVGAADSWGSIGFHQIQSRYLWGQVNGGSCADFANRNLYQPDTATAGIVLWGARAGCGTAMRSAMSGNYDAAYDNSGTTKVRRSSHSANALLPAVDYNMDNYERLSKGIWGYNQGSGSVANNPGSWPGLLQTVDPNGATVAEKGMRYAMEVKNRAAIGARNYLWQTNGVSQTTGNTITFCFWYGETAWFAGTTWQTERDDAFTQAITPGGVTTVCP